LTENGYKKNLKTGQDLIFFSSEKTAVIGILKFYSKKIVISTAKCFMSHFLLSQV
jgi:hypothetical protein